MRGRFSEERGTATEHSGLRAGFVYVARDREWIAAVDHDVSLRVADQEERDRNLDIAEAERAAVEQVELRARRHGPIVCAELVASIE